MYPQTEVRYESYPEQCFQSTFFQEGTPGGQRNFKNAVSPDLRGDARGSQRNLKNSGGGASENTDPEATSGYELKHLERHGIFEFLENLYPRRKAIKNNCS